MKLNNVTEIELCNNDEDIYRNIETIKKYFEYLTNKNVVVKLTIDGPQINHYRIYGNFSYSDLKKIIEYYPGIDVEKKFFAIKRLTKHGKIGFSVYPVKFENMNELIDKHEKNLKQ